MLQHPDIWFWTLLGLITAILLWLILLAKRYAKLNSLTSVRCLTLTICLFLLLEPKISWQDEFQQPLHWNIYTDNSVSMTYHQSLMAESYFQHLREFISVAAETDNDVKLYHFDQAVYSGSNTDFDLNGVATDFSLVFDHIKESQPELNGAIIISDGIMTKGDSDLDVLKDIHVPVHIIGVGDTVPMVDVAVKSIAAPTVVIKGEAIDIDVTVAAQGDIKDRINILLYHNNELIGSKYFQISGAGSLSKASFKVSSETLGKNTYTVKATVLKDEINIENNSSKFDITVLKDRYKVALLTGAPNLNTGPLKRIINRLPRVEMDHYVQLQEVFKPTLQDFWSKPYELIVFDNFPIETVTKRWQQILAKKIIAQNTSLLFLGGPNVSMENSESIFPFFHVNQISKGPLPNEKFSWVINTDNPVIGDYAISLIDDDHNDRSLPPLTPALFLETSQYASSLAFFESVNIPLLIVAEKEGLRSGIWTATDFGTIYYKLTETDRSDFSYNLMKHLFDWLLKTTGDTELYFRLNKNSFQQGEEIYVSGTHVRFKELDLLKTSVYINILNDGHIINTYELNFNPINQLWEKRFMANKADSYIYMIHVETEQDHYTQEGEFYIDESQVELNQVYLNNIFLEKIAQSTNGIYTPWKSRAEIHTSLGDNVKKDIVFRSSLLNENYLLVILLILLLSGEWLGRRLFGLN